MSLGFGSFTLDTATNSLSTPTTVQITFDYIHIKNDHDPWWSGGKGEIYVNLHLSDGRQQVDGRWPPYPFDTQDIGSNSGAAMGTVLSLDTQEAAITVIAAVREKDPYSDDYLVEDMRVSYSRSQNYAQGLHTHDPADYRLEYTINYY